MPTWSKGEKAHEGGDERCLGATNFETIGNDGQENAQGVAERYNILKKKTAKSNAVAILCHILNMQVMAGEDNFFVIWGGT